MDFVVSTCILHFIVQVKCKNSEALQRSVHSGGAPAPGAPLLPTPLIECHNVHYIAHNTTTLSHILLDRHINNVMEPHFSYPVTLIIIIMD